MPAHYLNLTSEDWQKMKTILQEERDEKQKRLQNVHDKLFENHDE